MATTDKEMPITLHADFLDMGLVHLLETAYTVIIERRDNGIVIELYNNKADECIYND